MANQLYTPEQAVTSGLAVLKHNSTLAGIVNTDYSREFVPGKGATVTVVKPVVIDPAKTYTKANRDAEDRIQYSELTQGYSSIKLEDQVYNAVKLPDDFMTFDVADLEDQVVRPMGESVAQRINGIVSAVFSAIPAGLTELDTIGTLAQRGNPVGRTDSGTLARYDDISALRTANAEFVGFSVKTTVKPTDLVATVNGDTLRVIRAAHRLLNERGVPMANRTLVVGSAWEAAIMSQDILNRSNESGTDTLLRQATLGNLYGFTVVVDYTIDPYAAYGLNKDAVTLATRVTAAPRGAAFSATKSAGGFTMRYLQDYDPDTLRDRAVIDLFAGAELLDAQRVVKITGTEGFEEPVAPVVAEPVA